MRCGVCHATLTVRGYRMVDVGNSNNSKRRVPLYHPCPRLNDQMAHPARAKSNYCTKCSQEYQARIQRDPEQRPVGSK